MEKKKKITITGLINLVKYIIVVVLAIISAPIFLMEYYYIQIKGESLILPFCDEDTAEFLTMIAVKENLDDISDKDWGVILDNTVIFLFKLIIVIYGAITALVIAFM